MRVAKVIVYLAGVSTFALASNQLSAQTTNKAKPKLMPSSALPTIDDVQSNRTKKSLRTVDTTTAQIAEERIPRNLPGKAQIVKTISDNISAKAVKASSSNTLHSARAKNQKLTLSRRVEILKMAKIYSQNRVDSNQIVGALRKFGQVSHQEFEFALAVSKTALTMDIPDLVAKINADLKIPLSESAIIQKYAPGKRDVSNPKLALVLYYYRLLSHDVVKRQVEEILNKNASLNDMFSKMMKENGGPFLDGGMERLRGFYTDWRDSREAELHMQQTEVYLSDVFSPDETFAELSRLSRPEQEPRIKERITQWFEKNDDEMYKVLEMWVKLDEKSRIIHDLLRARRLNPQESLNTLGASNIIQNLPNDHTQSRFKTWLENCLQPSEVGKKLVGVDSMLSFLPEYEQLYKKTEVELIRKLATWWRQDLTPDNVFEKLGLPGAAPQNRMRHEAYLLYERMWHQKSQTKS